MNIAGPQAGCCAASATRSAFPTCRAIRASTAREALGESAELNDVVAERLAQRTTAEWVEALNAAGVPCGPVYAMDEVFADEQVRHLDMVALDVIRNPVSMDGITTVRSGGG